MKRVNALLLAGILTIGALTGCGAKTLAIRQKRDTIIAVPFTALIANKTEQKENRDVLLGLYGESDSFKSALASYMESHATVKIMTTYDSLPKVCSSLTELGYDPYGRAQLVVDEWHLLLMSYAFRGDAIRGVLNEARQFGNVTYISATPVEEKFWFPEMQGLRKMEIE